MILIVLFLCSMLNGQDTFLAPTPLAALLAQTNFAQRELLLNNSFNRAIPDSPRDRMRPLHYKFSGGGYIISDFSSRQYTGFTLIDSLFLVPSPKRQLLGGDAQSQPILDSLNTYLFVDFQSYGLRWKNAEISSRIDAYFGGLVYTGTLFTLWRAECMLKWPCTRVIFGQTTHPFAPERLIPHLVTRLFGSPISPQLSLVPSIKIEHDISERLEIIGTVYSPYIFGDDGPIGFIPNYQRWSGFPCMCLQFNVTSNNLWYGMGLNYRRILPRIITSTRLINLSDSAAPVLVFAPPVLAPNYELTHHEGIDFLIFSAYGEYNNDSIKAIGQLLYGGNGMELYNFGGYGVRSFEPVDNAPGVINQTYFWRYATIPYVSVFTDIELAHPYCNFNPGIFVGYSQPLTTRNPLALDPVTNTYRVFTLDTAFNAINEIKDAGAVPSHIFSLLRIAPRLWYVASKHVQLGAEFNALRAVYSTTFDEFYRPTNPVDSTFYRITACVQMEFY